MDLTTTGEREAYPLVLGQGDERTVRELGHPADATQGMGMWGTDHVSTLLYVETVTVDHGGRLNPLRMTTHASRSMVWAERRMRIPDDRPGPGAPYTSRARGGGTFLEPHDDWSCLEDMLIAGLVQVGYDTRADHERSIAWAMGVVAYRTFPDAEEPDPGELYQALLIRGRWYLTTRGRAAASDLRAARARGASSGEYDWSVALTASVPS